MAQRARSRASHTIGQACAYIVAAVLVCSGHGRASDAYREALRPVDVLQEAVIHTMRTAHDHSRDGRFHFLYPVVRREFDLKGITKVAAGAYWGRLDLDQRRALVRAFGRYLAALYIDEFDSFDGERFDLTTLRAGSDGEVLVTARLDVPYQAGAAQPLLKFRYVLRPIGRHWRIEDVALDNVSGLQVWQSEFDGILHSSGSERLIADLQRKTRRALSRRDQPGPPLGLPDFPRLWAFSIPLG